MASAALGALPACKKSVPSGTAPPVVRIGYFANLTHAQAVLGVASGEYARAVAPSKLETRVFNAGPSLVEALFAGEIDIGYVGPGPAISAYNKSHGEGIRVIAGAAANGVVIVARRESAIQSVADLAGKRVATPQLGNTQDVSARHYLQAALKQDDLKNVIPIENAQQSAMLARGDVDAAWVPEPWGQRLISETGARLIAEEKDLWPNKEFVLTLVVTTPEFLAQHADVVERVLTAHRAWTSRLTAAPDAHIAELRDALFTLTGKKLDDAILGPALHRVKLTDEPLEETLRTFSIWTHDLGFDRGSPDVSHLVDATILRKLTAAAPVEARRQ
jgi:NitT/TauT family transport system substrate-binding protein